jgi:flagellar basal body-associated protein FliL
VLSCGLWIAFFLQRVSPEAKTEIVEKRSSRLSIALLIVAAVLMMAGVTMLSTQRTARGSSEGGSGRARATLHLEPFVINLADVQQRSYLRVGVDLGLSREIGRDENPPVARARDTILGILTQSQVDNLLTARGKDKLKDDVLHALQARLPELEVEEIYFTEFLIQR